MNRGERRKKSFHFLKKFTFVPLDSQINQCYTHITIIELHIHFPYVRPRLITTANIQMFEFGGHLFIHSQLLARAFAGSDFQGMGPEGTSRTLHFQNQTQLLHVCAFISLRSLKICPPNSNIQFCVLCSGNAKFCSNLI